MEQLKTENILNTRASGILLPIFSLPSKYGIGTLGKSAKDFIDFLEASGQTYWQILPIHPTTLENSPYTAFSSMAGNELFIDLETLVEQGFLKQADLDDLRFDEASNRKSTNKNTNKDTTENAGNKCAACSLDIDYKKVRKSRKRIFEKVFENFKDNIPSDYYEFSQLNHYWLDDYAMFMAIKEALDMAELEDWPEDYKLCNREVLADFANTNQDSIALYKVLQYFFMKQWQEMKAYANSKDIYIVGDIPFYVAHDSVDVWAHPEVFQLDNKLNMTEVAGCPPDAFSEEGQLWGNPIYNWKYLKRDKYTWWDKRIKQSFKFYDVLRIDHFRGFESYYTIMPDAENAKVGYWEKGPGLDFFRQLNDTLEDKPIIAEDLGFITEDVKQLLDACEYPGMKVLQFAFDSREPASKIYLPYKHTRNSVVYIGNHDNNTVCGWYDEVDEQDLQIAKTYLNAQAKQEVAEALIYAALGSVANTCILCAQDLLKLGTEARINIPGKAKGNWKWHLSKELLVQIDTEELYKLTKLFGRNNSKIL